MLYIGRDARERKIASCFTRRLVADGYAGQHNAD